MVKQVNTVAPVAANNGNNPQNLFMSVLTFDKDGKTIGERIVDLYHYGTRNWINKHLWWAMSNGNDVEVKVAGPAQITAYLANGAEALAAKFNKDAPQVAEQAAA